LIVELRGSKRSCHRRQRWCRLIRIFGGLPGNELCYASAGERRFQRQPGEDQATFEDRLLEAALEAGEPFVIVGGLPDVCELNDRSDKVAAIGEKCLTPNAPNREEPGTPLPPEGGGVAALFRPMR
jgi:hypothetical protein